MAILRRTLWSYLRHQRSFRPCKHMHASNTLAPDKLAQQHRVPCQAVGHVRKSRETTIGLFTQRNKYSGCNKQEGTHLPRTLPSSSATKDKTNMFTHKALNN